MNRKIYVTILAACLFAAGCGAKNDVSVETSTSISNEVSAKTDVTETSASMETPNETSVSVSEEKSNTSVAKEVEYSTIYDTVKSWGDGKTKSIKANRVIELLENQGYFLPNDGEKMMLVSNCNNYVKIHDSESDYQDTILISNTEGTYTLNQLSTTAITDTGNNSAQTTVHTQKTYTPSDKKNVYECTGFSKTLVPSESLVTELEASTEKIEAMLPAYTRILRDFANHIDDDYIFDATYQLTENGDTVCITVYQNIEGSDWGLVGTQYALSSTINLGPKDKIQRFSFSITSATNESYEYHADNEYQVQCSLSYDYDEESISGSITNDLKAEKEKNDKKNSKNGQKKYY